MYLAVTDLKDFVRYIFFYMYVWLHSMIYFLVELQIKSSLYSRYYAKACNEWRGPYPQLSAWTTQLRRNVAAVANRWRHCADLTGLGIEPQTSYTDSVRLATELTAGLMELLFCQSHYL